MSQAAEAALAELLRLSQEQAQLQSCAGLLEWDEETYLPPGAVDQRGAQQAVLARLLHERVLAPRFAELIQQVSESTLVALPEVAADLRCFWRRLRRARAIDPALVEALARTTAVAQHAWAGARARDDFAMLEPWLTRVVELKQQEAASYAEGGDAYDALLDEHEPGARAVELERLFAAVSQVLSPLVAELGARRARAEGPAQRWAAPIAAQRLLSERVAAALGFDFERGRLDASEHPFTVWIGPGDVRITTRFDQADFSHGLYSTLHEVGHGLYDQGLSADAFGRARGEPASAALHEALARLFENVVGRSHGFLRWLLPFSANLVPGLSLASEPALFRALNEVRVGETRIYADEISYDLHIVVRFELERALLSGALLVRELPAAWRQAYAERLGVRIESDTLGCLQDGHWAAGMFGYFPTYTLGNVMGSQLYAAACRALGDQEPCFARGEFAPLRGWLAEHVFAHGHLSSAQQIVEAASGQPLGPDALLERLQARSA